MNRDEFLDRAKKIAALTRGAESRAEQMEGIRERRTAHLAEIAKFDTEAARLEQEFISMSDATAEAELAVARHYAKKLEKNE